MVDTKTSLRNVLYEFPTGVISDKTRSEGRGNNVTRGTCNK